MNISYSEYSNVGGRKLNEDMVQITNFSDCVLAVVADGLGAYGKGDVASRLATSAVSEALSSAPVSQDAVRQAVQLANKRIIAAQHELHSDMKTTISLLWFKGNQAHLAHVGDTRIYQFRQGNIIFQTTDHSRLQAEAASGSITADQIRGHAARNQLTRALGALPEVLVDTAVLTVEKGDAFLLCSDGFWEYVLEKEMLDTLSWSTDAKAWLQKMLTLLSARLPATADNNSAIALIIH